MQPKYQLASGLVDQKAEGIVDARQKAEQLHQEAKDILLDATNKLQRLRGKTAYRFEYQFIDLPMIPHFPSSLTRPELERSFEVNQHILVEKAQALDGLENEARDVLQELSQKITFYSTCA